MKTQKEIHKFYVKEILPDLKQLELKRRKIHRVLKIVIRILLIAWIPLTIVLIPVMEEWPGAVFGAPGILMIVYVCFYAPLTRDFHRKVTRKTVDRLIRFIVPDLHLEPRQTIPKGTFIRSGLFVEKVNKYRGQNRVFGKIGKTHIEFSEIEASGKDALNNVKDFEGLFFVADFNKHFRTRTLVLPDAAEALLGSFGQTLQSLDISRPPLVKLDNPEFEKNFVVYSDDQIEARYLLSPALMDRIVTFQNKYNRCLYLSFAGSRIFIAVHSIYPLFRGSVYTSLFDFDQIKDYTEMLQLALDVVNDLDLNTRIWTKE